MCEKAYRLRLYPTEEQKTLIDKTIGCTRYIYNKFLATRIDLYKVEKKSLSYNQCSAALTVIKQEEARTETVIPDKLHEWQHCGESGVSDDQTAETWLDRISYRQEAKDVAGKAT